jgi:hypothetical protein
MIWDGFGTNGRYYKWICGFGWKNWGTNVVWDTKAMWEGNITMGLKQKRLQDLDRISQDQDKEGKSTYEPCLL